MPRGKLINTASIANPTMTWNIAEGTPVPLFDCTNFVKQITGTIFPVSCMITVGRDLLQDSIVNLAVELANVMGNSVKHELDRVVAVGDGTTQPQGLFTASGLTVVSSDNSTPGPPTVADMERLIFSVPKQYRTASNEYGSCFVMNDVTYSRVRGVPVGPADERRVFGLDEQSYSILGYPVRIQPNIPNASTMFASLKRYRLWRRAGWETRWETGGIQLIQNNQVLIWLRGRYYGKVLDAGAFAVCTSGQS